MNIDIFQKEKYIFYNTVSLISGKAFQRRKPRDGNGRSNAADVLISRAKLKKYLSNNLDDGRIFYLKKLNQDQVEVVFEELYQIEVYPKE